MKRYISIITSIDKKENADIISNKLLEERLSPCVQKIKGVESSYIWNNEIQKDNELFLIIKTKVNNKKKIVDIIEKMHGYDTPEIISIDFDILSKKYEEWFNDILGK